MSVHLPLQVRRDGDGKVYGYVEYAYQEDMENALRKLDDTEIRTIRGDRAFILVDPDNGGGGAGRRDRSRSPPPRRGSPARSFSRSPPPRSRSPLSASRSPSRSPA